MARTVVIGHFPPPIHGQALATAELAAIGEDAGHQVVRLDTSGSEVSRGGARYVASRLARLVKAAAGLIRHRKGVDGVHLGVDADTGLAATVLLALLATRIGHDVSLHHHSFRYMESPKRTASYGFAKLQGSATHVVTCHNMEEALQRAYGPGLQTRIISVAYAVNRQPLADRKPRNRPTVIGTLGNLGEAKSLDIVLQTFDRLAADQALELRLAGPVIDDVGERWLASATARHGKRVKHVGRVDGIPKAEFLAGLDVFLFPSRHFDESFGLVVMEALRAGVPVLMVPNRCFGSKELGDAGLVVERVEDFPELAAEMIQGWVEDRRSYESAQQSALLIANSHLEAADRSIRSLLRPTDAGQDSLSS